MIIFLRIYKNYANLWVINDILTIKMFFDTNRVVHMLGQPGSKRQNEKIRDFMTKELLGIRMLE